MAAHHHSGDFGLDRLKLMVGGLAIAFVLTGCGAARTRGETTTGLSGLELFSGKTGAFLSGLAVGYPRNRKADHCKQSST